MRSGTAIVTGLLLGLLLSGPARAEEEFQNAKVYRDYPGYINPAICENPNIPAAETNRQCLPPEQFDGLADVPYLSAWGGVAVTQDIDFDPDVELSFDAGYAIGLALGYDFGPARLEIEASHRSSDINDETIGDSKVDDGDVELEIQTLMVNGFADFKTGGNLTPYLGAGIGCARIEAADDDDTVLAGQVAAGVLIAVSPTVAIDLGYRFMMTDDAELDGAELDVRQHTAMLGVQFRF